MHFSDSEFVNLSPLTWPSSHTHASARVLHTYRAGERKNWVWLRETKHCMHISFSGVAKPGPTRAQALATHESIIINDSKEEC